ncbi:MAG: YbjQ family protein [Acidimicrobiales bacterium]
MLVVTSDLVPGHNIIEVKGLAQGNTVRAKHVGRDIGAGLKSVVGGELKAYTELLSDSRREATRRMIEHATNQGANAIVAARYTTSAISEGASELFAYGTAVVIDRE